MELWRCLTQTGRSYKCITLSQANSQSHLSVTQMSSDKGMQLLSAIIVFTISKGQKRTNQWSSSDLLWPMLFWWLGLSFRLVVVKQKLFSQKSFSTVTETIVYFRSQVSHSYRSSLLCVTTKMKAAVHAQTCRSSLCERNAARHPSSPWPNAVGATWLACVSIHKMAKCGLYCISAP